MVFDYIILEDLVEGSCANTNLRYSNFVSNLTSYTNIYQLFHKNLPIVKKNLKFSFFY